MHITGRTACAGDRPGQLRLNRGRILRRLPELELTELRWIVEQLPLLRVRYCHICKNSLPICQCFSNKDIQANIYHKVMFLHLSVILFMGGWVSVRGVSLQRVVSVQRGLCQEGVLCPGGSLSGNPIYRTVTCGRYASYWNAFL